MQQAELRRMVKQCVRCGQCRSACPIFKEDHIEGDVSRGKLASLRGYLEGRNITEAVLNRILSKCLMCKTCAFQCPSGVKAHELILAGREMLVAKAGLPPVKRLFFDLLKHRKVFDATLSAASLVQGLGLKRLDGSGLGAVLRFPMPGLSRRRVLTPFAAKSLRKQYPEVIRVRQPAARVAFFTGCMTNYIYTDTGRAAIQVLLANQVEVVMPKQQHCCAFPILTSGDVATAKLMARHNIDVFSSLTVDAVITVCGSCGSAWRHEYQRLLADEPEYLAKLETVAAKCYDIAEYLVDVKPFDKKILGTVDMKVTIHDPCHLGTRGLNVTSQVRKLLGAIPGLAIAEMKEPGRCCGSGGSFSLAHYDLSRKINDSKVSDIAGTGADAVVMGCGSCRMHILDGLQQNGSRQNALHFIQILAKACEAGKSSEILAKC